MVTYEEIYEAFCVYAASRDQADWCNLWIICQRRVEALVKSHLKGRPPLEDIDGIISDATAKALQAMVTANDLSPDDVSKICWKACMHTITAYFDALKRWRRMEKMAAVLNSAKHY